MNFKSRKFQLVLTTALGIIGAAFSGAIGPVEALYSVVVLVLGLIVTIAIEDASKRGQIFEKAKELVEKAEWLIVEAGEMLTEVEDATGRIESDKPQE